MKRIFSLRLLTVVLVFLGISSINLIIAQALTGTVKSTDGLPMEGVSVRINGDVSNQSVTFADGSFRFWELPSEENLEVGPKKREMNPLNGVTTYDLYLIHKHIIGKDYLVSPYQLVAADIDVSGTITAFDIIKLRRLILLIDEEFPKSGAWRFVDTDHDFAGLSRNAIPIFPEFRTLTAADAGSADINFIGIKMGDVNGSAASNLQTTDTRDYTPFSLATKSTVQDNTVKVKLSAAEMQNLQAMQFSLNFDASQFTFEHISATHLPNLSSENFGLQQQKNGQLTFSWYNLESVEVSAEEVLFELTFSTKNKQVSENIVQISSDLTAALAFDNQGNTLQPEITAAHIQQVSNELEVVANYPNPFREMTTLEFSLPQAATVSLRIFDASGKTVYFSERNVEAGLQEFSIQKTDLKNTQGALFYQLASQDKLINGKMFLLP